MVGGANSSSSDNHVAVSSKCGSSKLPAISLTLADCAVGDKGISLLADGISSGARAEAQQVEALTLERCSFGAAGAEALGRAARRCGGGLRALVVVGNDLKAGGLEALVGQLAECGRLRELVVSAAGIDGGWGGSLLYSWRVGVRGMRAGAGGLEVGGSQPFCPCIVDCLLR